MEEMFNDLNDNLELSLVAAEAGIDAVDQVILYYSNLLEHAIVLLCEHMGMSFEDMLKYLEEKAGMVGLLEKTLTQLQAVIEVSEDI
jgi:hypothetical protein